VYYQYFSSLVVDNCEKLEVVWYAPAHGNRAVGRKFDVDEMYVR
jgi:hypothetical protein